MLIKKYSHFILISLFLFSSPIELWAKETYVIDQPTSKIKGWIKYSVVGKYQAGFEEFEGKVFYNPSLKKIEYVFLKVSVKSVKSAFPILDKIVKSKRILYAGKYPHIIFESESIDFKDGHYWVKGKLTLHGVTKTKEFSFDADFNKEVNGKKAVTAKGKWAVDRKEFGIIWNKLLDKAGIVVGNRMTVDWVVTAIIEESSKK